MVFIRSTEINPTLAPHGARQTQTNRGRKGSVELHMMQAQRIDPKINSKPAQRSEDKSF
jgi:hypothetical protein